MSSKYPEHAHLRSVKREAEFIEAFLEWVQSRKGYRIVDVHGAPVRENRLSLIMEFLDIDVEEYHAEKDRLVEELRLMNEPEAK